MGADQGEAGISIRWCWVAYLWSVCAKQGCNRWPR